MFGRSVSMYKRVLLFVNGFVVALLINGVFGQDIAFPDGNDKDVRHRFDAKPAGPTTTETTVPIKTTTNMVKCGQNMILEIENGTTGFCECLEGYVYYPELDQCYSTYMKGPCQDGYYLILHANETVARCTPNPCKVESEVLYQGSCHSLLSDEGPCPPHLKLVISEKTYEPTCDKIQAVTYQVITAPLKPCAPGSRRAGRGLCRSIL